MYKSKNYTNEYNNYTKKYKNYIPSSEPKKNRARH